MKRVFTMMVGLLLAFQLAQAGKKKGAHSCDADSYTSEVVKKEQISESCIRYEVKVSYDGTRSDGLSHYSIDIPCGEIKDAGNSKRWKTRLEKDRKTGKYTLKVEDIHGFGRRGKDDFTVKFTWCSPSACSKELGVITYKAGKCVSYDTLSKPEEPQPPQTCSSLLATLEKTNVTCDGQSNGRLQVVVQEGETPLKYAWSNGATTASIDNLTAGAYGVTVTDAKGNTLTLQATVTAPAPIAITEAVVNPSCSGQNNGSIALTVTGGTGGYSYAWSTGATTKNVGNLPSGFYTVTVTDSTGCSAVKAIMLTNGALVSAEATLRQPTCTAINGAIDITPVGGVAPYTYLWSNGATTQDLQNVAAGSYLVTITDAGGCLARKIYSLEVRSTIAIQYVVKPTSCAEDNSGGIDITIAGGTAPYKIKWADGPETEDRSSLSVGAYQIDVSDASGCTASSLIFVNKKTLQVSADVKQPTCSGGLGSITITPVGTGPYLYEWSNGATGSTLENLVPGNYTVSITDAVGCSEFQSYFIVAPGAINATGVISNSQCGAAGSFAIDLSVSGGNYPYTYVWSNGATTEDISNVNAGTYAVDVKDAGGCIVRKQFVIDAASISWTCLINPISTPLVCNSVGNFLTTSVTGATSYLWSISSSDNSWIITSATSDSTLIYTAGTPGSTATFTLTVVKNGCTQTCTYTTATNACAERDNTGGGDPSSSEPCTGTPTTPPVVVEPEPEPEPPVEDPKHSCKGVDVVAYPNPFCDRVKLEWTASRNEKCRLEIFDKRGNRVDVLFDGTVSKGQRCSFEWEASKCRESMYYYRCTTSSGVTHGKLMRK